MDAVKRGFQNMGTMMKGYNLAAMSMTWFGGGLSRDKAEAFIQEARDKESRQNNLPGC